MKTNIKKLCSLLLTSALLLSTVPFVGASAEAPNDEVTLSDGSKWLAQLGSNVALECTNDGVWGDYKITPSESADSGFKVMPAEPVAVNDEVDLSCYYDGSAPTFGYSARYSLDGLRSSKANYGQIEFYREETGNKTKVFLAYNGGTAEIAKFTATRATLANITIVKQDGSYYVSYKGNVLDAKNYSSELQEAVKLENYFPTELLENNGMLYFFCTAASLRGGARLILHKHRENYTTTYSHLVAGGDRNTPDSWAIKSGMPSAKTYTVDAAAWQGQFGVEGIAGGDSASYGIPVATVKQGELTSNTFMLLNQLSATPSANRYHYFDFSNDPTFATKDTVSIIYVTTAGATAHVAYNGQTKGCLNYLNGGAWYNCHFVSDGTKITGIYMMTGSQGGTWDAPADTTLQVGKPIYLRVRVDNNSDVITLTSKVMFPAGALPTTNAYTPADTLNAATVAALESDDIAAAKETADAFYASDYRYAASYEAEIAAAQIEFKYHSEKIAAAAAVDAAIENLAASVAVEDLLYQDIAAVQSVSDAYDALDVYAKTLVKNYATLQAYLAAIEGLTDDGRYRTSDGTVYRVKYDSDAIALDSDSDNGALEATLKGPQSAENSYLGVVTQDRYPIVSGKYEVAQYFGTADNSGRFGLTAEDPGDDTVFEGKTNNSFVLYRTESGNSNTFYALVDGESTECYKRSGTTRARIWRVGVTKQNGSYYMTVDDQVIDGTGYSEEVQEAVKLENHFDADFLANNYGVHFFAFAKSMHGGAYFRPTVTVENNLILDVQDRFGDPNNSVSGIAEKNVPSSSLTAGEDGNTYTFDVPSNGSVTLAEPINPDGFKIKANMATAGGNQLVSFAFSNDPLFLSEDTISLSIMQFSNATQTVYCNGAERTSRFSGFYGNSVVHTISFVKQEDDTYKLRLFTPGNDLTAREPDFASLMDAPIYLKISGAAATEPTITITNSVEDEPAFTTKEALDTATEGFLDAEATELAGEADATVETAYADTVDWWSYGDIIAELQDTVGAFTERQADAMQNAAKLREIADYINELATPDAPHMVTFRKVLLGADESSESYDFHHDESQNVLDLIRMKKILAGIVTKK